jgi:branched-chain amino acid transport system substrate-binding protein
VTTDNGPIKSSLDRRRSSRLAGAVVLFALLFSGVAATASSAAPKGNTASAPGVTATSINVGLITEISGPGSSEAVNIPNGFKARIDLQNSKGGVYGRKITFITEDDGTDPSQNQTAAAAEVAKGVFAIDDNSAVAFGAEQYLAAQGIPVVGGGYDGPEWTEPTYTNMFSTEPAVFAKTPRYAVNTSLIKKAGGKVFAAIGYAISPSSSLAATNAAISLKAAGFQVPYLNTTLPFGTANVTAIALQMKNDNVDSLDAPIDGNTELSLITAGAQAGIKWKYVILSTGYGQPWLDSAQAVAGSQGDYFGVLQVPVELHTPATIAEQAAFKKFIGFSGVPGFDWTEGWTSADLLIQGLLRAGKNPTRASFIKNLHTDTDFTAGGLLPVPTNFEKTHAPAKTECSYTVQLKGHKFVPTSTKPQCSNLVPGT